ncbi:MAG: hypothetical protein N2376_01125, partial [Clostridia bacterium]|nr:hypothetical protein [Clostridia bacterium]
AYVMGVSEKWSERFDAANIYPFYCPWFELTGMPFITYSAFHKALFDALECITLSMTSRPPIKTK